MVPTISRKFTDLLVRVFFSLGKKRPTEDPVNIQYFRKTFCETSQQLLTVKYSCHRCLVGSLIHVCGKKLYENGHRRCFNIFIFDYDTTWKVSILGFFSGPYCPAFGLNTERYSVSHRIQSECGKILTGKTPNMDTFHIVWREVFLLCLN